MTVLDLFELVTLWVAVKPAALVGLAYGAVRLLGRSSAAVRHAVWALTLTGILLGPTIGSLAPSWHVEAVSAWVDSWDRADASRTRPTAVAAEAVASPDSVPAEDTALHEGSRREAGERGIAPVGWIGGDWLPAGRSIAGFLLALLRGWRDEGADVRGALTLASDGGVKERIRRRLGVDGDPISRAPGRHLPGVGAGPRSRRERQLLLRVPGRRRGARLGRARPRGGDTIEEWTWDPVSARTEDGPEDPVRFELSEGTHRIRIRNREDGAALDRLLVTNEPVHPFPSSSSEPVESFSRR